MAFYFNELKPTTELAFQEVPNGYDDSNQVVYKKVLFQKWVSGDRMREVWKPVPLQPMEYFKEVIHTTPRTVCD